MSAIARFGILLTAALTLGHAPAAHATIDPASLEQRLGALDPANPRRYFELGEEVAYESDAQADIELARHLYVLAWELDRRAEKPLLLGPSVCLALADLAPSDADRRWLQAMARAARNPDQPAEDFGAPAAAAVTPGGGASDTAFQLAEALGRYRSGEYRRAQAAFERPDVHALLADERIERLLDGSSAQVLRDAQTEPVCRECRNKRIVRGGADPGDSGWRLCPTCHGNPGPKLTTGQLIAELHTESALLGGSTRTWSAQLATKQDEVLREIDPEELAARFGVDPGASLWRNGRWVSPGDHAK